MFKFKNIFFFMIMIIIIMFIISVYVVMGKIFFIIFYLYRCIDICFFKYFVGVFVGLLLKIFNLGDF